MTLSTPIEVQNRLEAIEDDLAKRQNRLRDRLGERVVLEQGGGDGPCWIWVRAKTKAGYGDLVVNREHLTAHKYTFREMYGYIPAPPLELDHLCRNRACCNPRHLEAVTHHVNMRRGGRTKLTLAQVDEIMASAESHRALARRYGVKHQAIAYYKAGHYSARLARAS